MTLLHAPCAAPALLTYCLCVCCNAARVVVDWDGPDHEWFFEALFFWFVVLWTGLVGGERERGVWIVGVGWIGMRLG